MLLERCSWLDVERRLTHDKRIALVLGATEEHSDLSLCTDTLIPFEIARRACELSDVLLAPSLPFGISAWSAAYPGTISLRITTLAVIVEDIMHSLLTSGFRHFFVLNGHGLNRAIAPVFGESVAAFPEATISFVQWWELEGVRELAEDVGAPFGHANWCEAFPFTVLGGSRNVKPTATPWPNLLKAPAAIRAQAGLGHASGPVQLNDALMEKILCTAVTSFCKRLEEPCST